ncbi:MAG: deoxyguanosinetriphosphate triphosphohydrolase [candidate division Zixibacteria bacterium SM23_73_3]|nr:MAG: deoxyguanosinetriphosphate triphosphohydrolase [candidate division Zixibacteria bacterium SM23_73_3]
MAIYNCLREELEDQEERYLASYAMKNRHSRGRKYPEEDHPVRTNFQRDRDRIIHSTAFRRLEFKTQVFVSHEGDHYRTRLTHTIEVAQISRSIARALRLNEDLAEAMALVHDLGHTPFGHAGEETLNQIMKDHGGFEHNRQTLRVVDLLEEKYPDFPGLNLTYEVREGIMKHETVYDHPVPAEFNPDLRSTLECQLVNLADEVAYHCHDIDDGLASDILKEEELNQITLWGDLAENLKKQYPQLSPSQRRHQLVRTLINFEVSDLIKETKRIIQKYQIKTLEDVRNAGENTVKFSKTTKELNSQLRGFLFEKMYRHYRMIRMADKARRIITQLFEAYLEDSNQLPPLFRQRLKNEDKMQLISDYIAGMTDRFALQEYKKLFDPFERV